MNLTELRKRPHLSVSGIEDYMECGLHYKFSRIDNLKPKYRADALVFGSAIHSVLAEFNGDRLIGKIITTAELRDQFEHHWEANAKGQKDILYKKGKTFESLMQEGKELIRVFGENIEQSGMKNHTVIAIEEAFEFYLQGLPIPMIGAMDLVEEDELGGIHIIDYKTSSAAYSAEKVRNHFQLTVYQIAAKSNGYGDRVITVGIDCLIKTKEPKFERYVTARASIDEARAVKRIQSVWKGIEKKVFIPNTNSWKCNACEYIDDCNDWHNRD
jgi:putative RecB family exonuclease